jgi:hypothetical protein
MECRSLAGGVALKPRPLPAGQFGFDRGEQFSPRRDALNLANVIEEVPHGPTEGEVTYDRSRP